LADALKRVDWISTGGISMSSDDNSGGWLTEAVSTGRDVAGTITNALGVQEERHVCPDCGTACEKTTTHDPRRAAFHNGESPAWTCPDCGTDYRRDPDTDRYTSDLYGRSR
jgi:predicted RNA-binding Zn-ribbon protein involved in translation (DUF1610 family)